MVPATMGQPTRSGDIRVAATSGRRLLLARGCWWVVAILSLLYFVTGLPDRFPRLALYSNWVSAPPAVVGEGLAELGLSQLAFAGYSLALVTIRAAAFYLIGLLVFWRRSRERMALLVAFLLVAEPSGETAPPTLLAMMVHQPVRAGMGIVVGAIAFLLLLWLFFLFPDGHFRPRWAWIVAAIWTVVAIGTYLLPNSGLDLFTWPTVPNAAFFFGCLGAGVFAQVWRYRRISGPVERQQAKWFAVGLTAALGTFATEVVITLAIPLNWPDASPAQVVLTDLIFSTVHNLAFLAVPVTLAIAILRHHLWDIDVIIRRTLVYGALTVALGAIYFGGVALLRGLLFGGQSSNISIVASTLAIAALFQPLRTRIRRIIDRRFYRRKYDAARTLAEFGTRLRDEVDLDAVSDDLISVVHETVQPEHVSLWLRSPEVRR